MDFGEDSGIPVITYAFELQSADQRNITMISEQSIDQRQSSNYFEILINDNLILVSTAKLFQTPQSVVPFAPFMFPSTAAQSVTL